jgi:hypothetical protein
MVDEHSPLPDPPKRRQGAPLPHDPDQAIPLDRLAPEEELDDEPYTDPERARRLAAVRTELFRRNQPRWEPEE